MSQIFEKFNSEKIRYEKGAMEEFAELCIVFTQERIYSSIGVKNKFLPIILIAKPSMMSAIFHANIKIWNVSDMYFG